MANSSMKFQFIGWVHSISETQETKNGLKYKKVRVTENKEYWLMFMFDNKVKLNCMHVNDLVKIDGFIVKKNTGEEFFRIEKVQVMNKNAKVSEEPSIDEDIKTALEK